MEERRKKPELSIVNLLNSVKVAKFYENVNLISQPISLLSVLSKVMEKLINKPMWKHLENHKLISDRQFGFRAGHSTSDALTYIAQRLSNTINDREEARVVCLDISKAFDSVWHPGLLVKLRALGFAGKLLHWLADYLRNHSMKVILNEKSSSTKFINAGVPQGSILGPLLFIIFIDDIGYIKHLHPVY